MMASGRSLSIAAKALSNSSLLLILIGLIAVPVASPPSWICSRKGLEKGSVALARAVTRRADGSMSRINWTHLPDSSAVTHRDAGDISTRSGKAHDKARADRISGLGHHDRDFP